MKENNSLNIGFEDEELKQYNLLYEQKQKELMEITTNKVKNLELIQTSNDQKIIELRELNLKSFIIQITRRNSHLSRKDKGL